MQLTHYTCSGWGDTTITGNPATKLQEIDMVTTSDSGLYG